MPRLFAKTKGRLPVHRCCALVLMKLENLETEFLWFPELLKHSNCVKNFDSNAANVGASFASDSGLKKFLPFSRPSLSFIRETAQHSLPELLRCHGGCARGF